jgi:HAD superfamily hydrolase (TIGR01509 family)
MNKHWKAPSAVIFDMDGVICDTREHHLLAFQELTSRYGRELSAEEFQHLFGMENRKLIPHLFGSLNDEEIQSRADWKEARYRELISDQIELMPGVRETIDWLSDRGRGVAVASSAPRANVRQILESTGLIDRVGAYLASEDVQRHKPHPEVFLTAAQRIDVDPTQSWVIEDSLHGIHAGLSAGMTVMAVATTHPASALTDAHGVFDGVAHVLDVLKACG